VSLPYIYPNLYLYCANTYISCSGYIFKFLVILVTVYMLCFCKKNVRITLERDKRQREYKLTPTINTK
jgi:hypothetical protein